MHDTLRNVIEVIFGYLIAFLASDYADYINGANIPIDGGLLKSM